MMRARLFHLVLGLTAMLSPLCPALAQHPIPEAERWATITHAGNAPYIITTDIPGDTPRPVGQVNYEYQISRTEVTGAEWFEFVQAYAPYVGSDGGSALFTSERVRPTPVAPGVWEYSLRAGLGNHAVTVSWHYAARYVNWLHNGRRPEQSAFESGVYDTSTFGGDVQIGFTDQRERSPGATYFIPTLDEWTKACYFDPDRVDPVTGDLGYWLYPNSSDVRLIPGPPGVGQTSAGQLGEYPVASYVNYQSPWGLFDTSGSEKEWTETASFFSDGRMNGRLVKGAPNTLLPPDHPTFEIIMQQDRISWTGGGAPNANHFGFRLGRVVPSPGVTLTLTSFAVLTSFKRQRR